MRRLLFFLALLSLIINLAGPTVLYSAISPTYTNLYTGNTVGLMVNDTSRAYPGYTLMSPKKSKSTYLIDNQGQVVHTWSGSQYSPGQSAYLLENGHLLRPAAVDGGVAGGAGGGGRVEEFDWDGNLVWSMDYYSKTSPYYAQHHDIWPLPNGNIIMLVAEYKTVAEAVAAGCDPANLTGLTEGYLLPDTVVEVQPNRVSGVGGTVVWEWKVWDHLVQAFDAAKPNYGVVSEHPELIDINGNGSHVSVSWNHMNSITYNPAFDQIMVSEHNVHEVWIIDHSTTTAEAAGHTGGLRGKGGDLIYRWGNPAQYDVPGATSTIDVSHCASWIPPGYPGAGNITYFNNGLSRLYSTADEFTPPVDENGNYSLTPGSAFGPTNLTWTYVANPPASLYDAAVSSVQRLPNGNTLIDSGTHGRFIEVTPAGETVWEYVNPVVDVPLGRTDAIPEDNKAGQYLNAVFKALRYPLDYPGLAGRDLTPRGPLETSNFNFTVTKGGPGPAGQILSIKNTGIGTLNWTVSAPSYIIPSPASGSSTGEIDNVTLSLNMSIINTMATGTWNDNITVAASGATTSPQNIAVKVTILPSTDKTVTVTQSANGTISPGTTIVPFGGNQTFNIAAISGYHIANVLVDGASVGAVASYTFTSVIADHTLTAVYLIGEGNGGVGPCNEATITSTIYTVSKNGTANETITNVPAGTAKATFLAALSKAESHQTWNDAGISDPVVTGNTLVVTAEDTTTIVTYTVTVNAVAPPTITTVSPSIGSVSGGLSVTITGTNFTGATAVTFGSTAATTFTVNSATQITCTSPAYATAAIVDVSVTTPAGTGTKTSAFTYKAANEVPNIASVTPNIGSIDGGDNVTIAGGKLNGTILSLTFNDVSATNIVLNIPPSPAKPYISCLTPASVKSGLAKINLTTNNGSTTNVTAFTYNASQHTVFFNANGGTGSMANQTASVPTALTLNAFTRTGYSFSGWNTAANGSGTSYGNGATYSFTAGVTLYAQWTPIPHTVTFNANGGTGSMSPQTASAPTALTLNAFTQSGYTFSGWNTLANGTGTAYTDGATYSFAADITLYAQWTVIPSHTVTFDANGGTGSMSAQTASTPTVLTLNTFTQAGYTFSGWNTLANGTGTSYADGATYSFAADVTLYAQWTLNTASVNITVTLQGTGRPSAGFMVPLTVNILRTSDNFTLYSFTENMTRVGLTDSASAVISGITPGTYNISVVAAHSLTNVKKGVVITTPSTDVNMGTLLEGDADGSNVVNLGDFSLLAKAYGKSTGESGFDSRTDFDCSGTVNLSDFSLLAINYGKIAPVEVP